MTHQQQQAADPKVSAWVAASAGTGKTKVLTDRVLRLLLAGNEPGRLLCLTYTKAAAAEMKNRIHRELASWAAIPEEKLRKALEHLTGAMPAASQLARARRLFIDVLDAPDGLKIQTIHAFCQALIRRFPLEADVAPHFQVMDEQTQSELMAEARLRLMAQLEQEEHKALRDMLDHLQCMMDEGRFNSLLQEMLKHRAQLNLALQEYGSIEGIYHQICEKLGIDEPVSESEFLQLASGDDVCDASRLREAVRVLQDEGGKNDKAAAEKIATWLASSVEERAQGFAEYASAYLTQKEELRAGMAVKAVAERHPEIVALLLKEQQRVYRVIKQLKSLQTAERTKKLLHVSFAILEQYEALKALHAQLDYDDLILKTVMLLRHSDAAAWVLYKLDGGIDHLLIDEAQDTSLEQWLVVSAICNEFYAGEGARDMNRTLFVVGDEKQSIYSFQGADPMIFNVMQGKLREACAEAGKLWRSVGLERSFRSTSAVLAAVDEVFAFPALKAAVSFDEQANIRHEVNRVEAAGRVEIWPLIAGEEKQQESWPIPRERKSRQQAGAKLAEYLAQTIASWIEQKRILQAKGRPVKAGDILILLRKRGALADQISRALKRRNVPVSGADRLVLTDHLAIQDLMALGRFLLLPQDDLTLAALLKTPLCGLSEEQLFMLAVSREKHQPLWDAIKAKRDESPYKEVVVQLSEWLDKTDFLSPFELFSYVLEACGGREKLLARLGKQSEDPIDEFLNQLLAYEKAHVPSLQGLMRWLESGSITIKRDMEQSGNAVRIMTVHGSKGLQAPIVLLADAASLPSNSSDVTNALLWAGDDLMVPIWSGKGEADEESKALHTAREKKALDEYYRLLYVAMTRAEDELYLLGTTKGEGDEGKAKKEDMSWYGVVKKILEAATKAQEDGKLVLEHLPEQITKPAQSTTQTEATVIPVTLPAFLTQPPAPEPDLPTPLTPSAPSEEVAASGAVAAVQDALARGKLVHTLLQYLPDMEPEKRERAALNFLKREGVEVAEAALLVQKLMAILTDERFAAVFSLQSKAEVPVVGVIENRVISGQIDRLAILEDKVLIIDYKTNRKPPKELKSVPVGYIKQMAAYRALLTQIYPGREIECALLWVESLELMVLPATP